MEENWTNCKKQGSYWRLQGDLAQAIEWYKRALKYAYTVNHLDVALLHNILAKLYIIKEDYKLAETSARISLQLQIEFGDCGEETTDLADYYMMLAQTLEGQNRYAEASEWAKKSLPIFESLIGRNDSFVIDMENYYRSLKDRAS